ncbi:hypothetical protein A6R68_07231, partial [Neotoma lepida]
ALQERETQGPLYYDQDRLLPTNHRNEIFYDCVSFNAKHKWCSLNKTFQGYWKYCSFSDAWSIGNAQRMRKCLEKSGVHSPQITTKTRFGNIVHNVIPDTFSQFLAMGHSIPLMYLKYEPQTDGTSFRAIGGDETSCGLGVASCLHVRTERRYGDASPAAEYNLSYSMADSHSLIQAAVQGA